MGQALWSAGRRCDHENGCGEDDVDFEWVGSESINIFNSIRGNRTNMKYGDEKIAKLLNQHKKGIFGDLENGLYIKEELFHFRRISLCSNKFSMMIPLRLQPPDEEFMQTVYKNERPDEVFCHRRRNMLLQISVLEDFPEDVSVVDCLQTSIKSIEKLKTGIVVYMKDEIRVNDIEIAWVDYKSMAINMSLYNIYALLDIDNIKYQLAFYCSIYEGMYWREVIKMMLSSIKLSNN